MAQIRLFKKIYSVKITKTGSSIDQTYTLIDPFLISASTHSNNSSTVLENLNPIRESTGVYYVDLNPKLYNWDDIYNVSWFVTYISSAPVKKLLTTFRIIPSNIGNEIEIELVENNIDIEIE